ncbi:MAG: YkgJ family cysteine cluster protein [Dehalococcoidales bacterium]|nr:YkgJ family cysteine cluster protein [Dehalococcoidales bacterium]
MNTRDLERLYRDVEQGKIPFLAQGDEFKWSGCTMCGLCCFDIDILLNPYDILRLRRHLSCTTSDLIQRGLVEIFPGGNSGLPLAMIKFRKVDKKTSLCPFLAPVVDGEKLRELTKGKEKPSPEDLEAARIPKRLACGIYSARPAVCRSSPLGRMSVRSKDGEGTRNLFYQPPTAFCPACQGEGRVKGAKWIEDNGVQPYWDASERFQNIFSTLFENGLVLKEGGDRAVAILWNLAAGILYDFDSLDFVTKEFPQNRVREDGEEDLRLLTQLLQMVEAIATTVPQVKKMVESKVRQ